MTKPTIVPLSGSPEARARMARWLEARLGYAPGSLDDVAVPELGPTPFDRLIRAPGGDILLKYEPRGSATIDLAPADED